MEILDYSEGHKAFRHRLKEYIGSHIRPRVDQWEAQHIVPKGDWKRMGQNGFLCTAVNKSYGGMEGDFLYSLICAEEMAKTHQSGFMTLLHSDIVVPYIESYGSEAQKRKYLPDCVTGEAITAIAMTEPDAGSDLASMRTTAVRDGDDFVINGSKIFISNGVNCDLVVLAAKDPAAENPHKSISLFIVEDGTPGFKKGTQLEKMGMHSQDTAELFFSNCRIPTENLLGEKGDGFVMLMKKLQQERLVCSIWALSRAEHVLQWTIDYCQRESIAGAPLFRNQSVQFDLAEMATQVKMSRCFVEKLVADHMEERNAVMETSMAKYQTSEMINEVTGRCMDIVGRDALDERCPLAREWRDVRVMTIFAGTNEIMKGIIAKGLSQHDFNIALSAGHGKK
ncbi:MAG: acyl-CoA dehydrogenase family protein [Desulfobacteraceae bacterium]|jgi:alkylation response protein AidB-like acyl-CoA dehydrogenase|uniref:Acyl-[acyl-carrier-protein] dehydrogenase MbtN n=1 Tax=Desulfosarcina alkanivorans TaxID=571177 RepID=A0A5K7YNE6_9BACT|nr:acyl-CoA dehydrogenase family protein [Desulfosarcina alkanivorans]MEE4605392.1 acyl-CoA dehydrogenase family protein [Desulfobacteraceae bacterium]BBO69790.1 acyl-CoA dehydrogenase [Desulfosarcina alkanivorans]